MKYKILILSLLALSLSACGPKRLKSNQVQNDITRPPEIAISGTPSIELPKSADETVSYEEWLKENAPQSSEASK